MTGKLGRAWVGTWVGAWHGAWVHGGVYTTWIGEVGLGGWGRSFGVGVGGGIWCGIIFPFHIMTSTLGNWVWVRALKREH